LLSYCLFFFSHSLSDVVLPGGNRQGSAGIEHALINTKRSVQGVAQLSALDLIQKKSDLTDNLRWFT
jgi:hypothetical protein